MITRVLFGGVLLCVVTAGVASLTSCQAPVEVNAITSRGADGEGVPAALAVAEDWRALVALDLGATGIWTAEALDLFPQFGGQEVVALDDLGRCHVLVQYATKWTDLGAISDGTWLGGVALAELDSRIEGAELYVGAKTGNVYQLAATREGVLDARLVANVGGQEVHAMTVVGGELVVFTSPGSQWRLAPDLSAARFTARETSTTGGRVRDIARLADGRFATVSRAGELTVYDAQLEHGVVALRVESGLGRVAVGASDVLYTVSDDGVVWRSYEQSGAWHSARIHVGAPGPRGIVAGSFTLPAPREEVALFGYSADVELLTRADDGSWSARTIFTDRDRGHWLRRAELDQRNGTDELIGSGYGGRVFVLARPPGYGLAAGVARSPEK
jgi:hypothetical protein